MYTLTSPKDTCVNCRSEEPEVASNFRGYAVFIFVTFVKVLVGALGKAEFFACRNI